MKKVLILIIALLVLIIGRTYAIFYSTTNGGTRISLAKWDIELNNNSLTSYYDNEIVINNVVWTNNNANNSTIAPGSSGHFDIIIDPNNTDVSFIIEVNYIDHTISADKFLTVTSISMDGINFINTGLGQYKGIFPLNSGTKTLSVNLEWVNDEDNNDIDSLIGLTGLGESVSLSFNAKQYNGEVIE